MTDAPEMDPLLASVRAYLNITWDDPAGDQSLAGIIARGKAFLDDRAGETLDYETEADPRQLLMDYCMYVRSHALDQFLVNYKGELIALRLAQEVNRYAADNPEPDPSV